MPAPRTLPLGSIARLGLVAAGLLGLAGCGLERPTPEVTVWPGRGLSVNTRALCWSEEGTPQPADCSSQRADLVPVDVRPNETVLVNVDPELEETGWVPALNGTALVSEPLTNTSYRFTLSADQLRGDPELQIFAVDRIGAPAHGIWAFRLQRDA